MIIDSIKNNLLFLVRGYLVLEIFVKVLMKNNSGMQF